MLEPVRNELPDYGVSVYDDATARIVKAKVLANFGEKLDGPAYTRLRLNPGTY